MRASKSFLWPPSSTLLFSFRLLCALSPSPWLTFHCQQMAPAWVPFLFSLFWTSSMSLLFLLSFYPSFSVLFLSCCSISLVLNLRDGSLSRIPLQACCSMWYTLLILHTENPLPHSESSRKLLKTSKNLNVVQWNRSWHVKGVKP